MTVTRDGAPVGPPITVARHVEGVPIAYYPLRFTPERTGVHQAAATIDGTSVTAAFEVGGPDQVDLLQRGDPLRPVATPTATDHRGVEPICTRKPEPCPLHDRSLDEVLAAGRPVAYLVSSPQFCQIGVCGPVLELLLEQHAARPDIAMVHAEVYADTRGGDLRSAELAPAVQAYSLSYEPALFVAGADGRIVERLDNVFDRAELQSAIAKV
jgi:hypothetical protein